MAVSNAFALPTVTFTDGPGTTGGGEFNAQTSANGNLVVFCLEYNEHLAFNTTYYYEVSQAAKYNGGTSTMDPLSRPTAWLYTKFLDGTLGSYGAEYYYDGGVNDANSLQQAIWYLENETGGVDNLYAQLAVAQAGSSTMDNNGFYGAGVMNLWANADGTGARQDQLMRVPDGGSTLALLGMGMGFLALVSRRIRS
jgi:hypothetical protein